MKPTLFLCTAIILVQVGAFAQPTINLGDITPVFGTSVIGADATYADPGAAGANQTWDLSGMTPEIVSTTTFLSPSGLPESSSFPEATHTAYVLLEGANELYGYVAFANNKIEDLGYFTTGPDLDLIFTRPNPRTVVSFPLNYNDTFSDTYENLMENTTENGVLSTVEIGSFEAQVDGYGTLTTPAGTFTDVLRVRYETESNTTLSINGEVVSTSESTGTEYQYYKSGFPIPLATTTTNVLVFMGIVIEENQSGAYYMDMSVGLEEKEPLFSNVQLFPMPASTHIELMLNSKSGGNFNLNLLSATGKMVYQWNQQPLLVGQNQLRLELPELAAGNYLLQIYSPEGMHTERLVIGK